MWLRACSGTIGRRRMDATSNELTLDDVLAAKERIQDNIPETNLKVRALLGDAPCGKEAVNYLPLSSRRLRNLSCFPKCWG